MPMGAFVNRWMVAITAVLILFAVTSVTAETKTFQQIIKEAHAQCQGKFKGKKLSPEELNTVLNNHRIWYEALRGKIDTKAMSDPRKANLCGAKLPGADLSKANLSIANLSKTDLSDSNLCEANLMNANLSEADLWSAKLSGADLSGAYLNKANLLDADLSNAILSGANLHRAILTYTNLSRVILWNVNLSNVKFEPKDLPDIDGIASAFNLSQMYYKNYPQALFKLRKAFKERGYYQQEREVTYAIQHSVTILLLNNKNLVSLFEVTFRYIFFDFTCKWGMAPGRAFLMLLSLIPVFTIPYMIALHIPGKNGIWRKWADDRVRVDLGTKEPTRMQVGWLNAFVLGFYFSVLSAFNIGWRELNVGNWIQRFQTKEYTLKASGWVRTVSGVQSLISVYLLAIWVLTYFGRPFE